MQLNKTWQPVFFEELIVEQDVGMQMEEDGVSFYIQFEAFGQKWTWRAPSFLHNCNLF